MIEEDLAQFSGLKIFKHLDRLCKLRNGEIFYPVSVDFSPTNACNHNCIWCCYGGVFIDRETLDKELMLKIVDELASLGVKGINFTGGCLLYTSP
ncbi:radical SAM protein, partial [Candidatus Pacearchaeota archaeon]|nr:radical SAM protein [Candidatus Pacearchaeota archaeon]